MHFQVRTDNHIPNSEGLEDRVRAEVEGAVHRFDDRIRRIEVYLQDMNGHKGGVDTRCSIEVTIAGHSPVAVDHRATDVDEAVSGATDRMVNALDKTFGRLEDRPNRVSMSGEET